MILITNFKTYENALWKAWFELARKHSLVKKQTWKDIRIAWNPLDLRMLLELDIPVLSQWADLAEYWSYTWKILPIKLKKIWCSWVLLNHSENRISDKVVLKKIIERCKELGLETIVCAESVDEWVEVSQMWADFIAVEPPELIWWDISVSKANPEIIEKAVLSIWEWKVIIWAWIKDSSDVLIAKKLWAVWILLASWITKSDDPEGVLRDLASAI